RAAEAGEIVELRELLSAYSNAVVTRATTGAAGATAEKLKKLLGNSAAIMSGLQADDVLPDAAAKVVRWATGLEKRLDAELEQWDKFLSEIIAEHLEKKPDNGAGEESFLDVLLRLREEGAAGLELTNDRIKSLIKVVVERSQNPFGFNLSANFNILSLVLCSCVYAGHDSRRDRHSIGHVGMGHGGARREPAGNSQAAGRDRSSHRRQTDHRGRRPEQDGVPQGGAEGGAPAPPGGTAPHPAPVDDRGGRAGLRDPS
uniref:Uncharacterized protein n=1 Tax=Aegilops tauschii subsp. strangulata TaxID=200361 RepID=A0A453LE21_AEGTS